MPLIRQAFLSSRVVLPDRVCPATLLVEDERIVAIGAHGIVPDGYIVQDFGEYCILPGLVDTHVHVNEPGRTEWEGFETGTRAASAGGYTTLVDMPLNCLPETTTVAALEAKRAAAAGKCRVDWAAWGGVVSGNANHIGSLVAAGVAGFKCFLIDPGVPGFAMVDEQDLRKALPHVAQSGLPLLVHAELPGPIDAAQASLADADWTKYAVYLASRPDQAELEAINLMIRLCREFNCRIHIVHLSSAQALESLRNARADGLPITIETCPHYLHFSAESIPDGATQFKCAPPIRTKLNQDCLWEGLLSGVIDLVATDHSPCPPEMKRAGEGSFRSAWGGIASLSTSLPVMWTELRSRKLSLQHLGRWMAESPATLAGLEDQKGRLAPGCDADFVVFDPEGSFTVAPEGLYYRHRTSAYMSEQLFGVVKRTYLRGCLVFEEGAFPGEAIGQELTK